MKTKLDYEDKMLKMSIEKHEILEALKNEDLKKSEKSTLKKVSKNFEKNEILFRKILLS